MQQFPQFVGGKYLVLHQTQRAAYMQDADDVVQFAFEYRQQGVMAGRQLFAQSVRLCIQIDRFDLVARHHDVVHCNALDVDQIEQHFLVFSRQEIAGLQHQYAQFLHCQILRALVGLNFDTQHPQYAAYDGGSNRYHRMEQFDHRSQHIAGRQSYTLGMAGGHYLGHDFAEYQDGEGDGQCADQQCRTVAVTEHTRHDDFGQCGGGDIKQGVAKEDRAKQFVGLCQQAGGMLGALVAFAHQIVQPVAV